MRSAVFRGFVLDAGCCLLPPRKVTDLSGTVERPIWPSERRLLFIGDAETTGFGNESPPGRLVPDPTNSNATSAFSCVCASLLRADAHLVVCNTFQGMA